jgi:myo-inositol-1(or 4)-monophosphatase
MPSPFTVHERAAVIAIKAGERELLKRFQPDRIAKTRYKKNRELVMAADHASNRAIQTVLHRLTPDVPVLSEEGSLFHSRVTQTRLQWILDPLDGTTNYTIGLPLWGISLALVEDGTVVRGWLSMPKLGEQYVAALEEGATKNGSPFRLKYHNRMRDGVGLFCHGYAEEERAADIGTLGPLMRHSHSTRRLGAACVELAWVATGRASYLVIYGAKPWDLAAGSLLVTEAGGYLSKPDGSLWSVYDGDLLAANTASYKEVIRVLKRA